MDLKKVDVLGKENNIWMHQTVRCSFLYDATECM